MTFGSQLALTSQLLLSLELPVKMQQHGQNECHIRSHSGFGCSWTAYLCMAWKDPSVINKQWVLLVITPDGCSGRTRWSSSIDLHPYLYYYYSGCTLESHSHISFSRMFCDHLTLSHDLAYWVLLYLYSYSIVHLKVLHQVFKCMGDLFWLGVLITLRRVKQYYP